MITRIPQIKASEPYSIPIGPESQKRRKSPPGRRCGSVETCRKALVDAPKGEEGARRRPDYGSRVWQLCS